MCLVYGALVAAVLGIALAVARGTGNHFWVFRFMFCFLDHFNPESKGAISASILFLGLCFLGSKRSVCTYL